MLPDAVVADERTRSRLGGDGLEKMLACLWPGDCQSCGQGLSREPPALLVDDLGVLTRASLHHSACRAPAWNDSSLITTSKAGLLTWRTVTVLLPFQARGAEIRIAGLLVKPGLEEVWLVRGRDAWHPSLDPGLLPRGWRPRLPGYPSGYRLRV